MTSPPVDHVSFLYSHLHLNSPECVVQHDIIVPTTQDARVYESDEDDIAVAPLYYTVSGSQLMVLKAQQNASAVINRLDFSTIPAFQSQKRLTLTNETSTVPIDTGLATFVARQIFQPSSGLDVLLVIGSAVGAAPVIRGTPNIVVGEPNTPRSPSYTHPTLRPFDTTVIILVNIEQPENPVVHSVSEHEGRFVTATEEQESWAWVFIRASAHVSADHDVEDDSQLDDTIMPVFRYIPHRSASSELEPWQSVGDCTDVNQLELASKRDQPSYMLVAQPVNINIFSGGGFVQGESVENKPELFVMGWSSQVRQFMHTCMRLHQQSYCVLSSATHLTHSCKCLLHVVWPLAVVTRQRCVWKDNVCKWSHGMVTHHLHWQVDMRTTVGDSMAGRVRVCWIALQTVSCKI